MGTRRDLNLLPLPCEGKLICVDGESSEIRSWMSRRLYGMTPEEESSEVREMIWEMSRTTNKILIFGIIVILAILAILMYYGILPPWQL